MPIKTKSKSVKKQPEREMQIVYLEVLLMPNNELLHYGKSLGFINTKQRELVDSKGAAKLTKGGEPIVAISPEVA